MRTTVRSLLLAGVAAATAGCSSAENSQVSFDLTGEWVGYAIAGDGTQLDFTMTLTREEPGYTGTLRTPDGTIPEIVLRNIVVEDSTFTCDLDFPTQQGTDLIEVMLRFRNDSLSGSYVDPMGDSDRVFFRRAGMQ